MVFCEVCNINTGNMSSHKTTKKHQNGGKTPQKENKLTLDRKAYDKEYNKKYYIDNNLKEKYKQKKECNICKKGIAQYNWSKHVQSEKHIKKDNLKKAQEGFVRNIICAEDLPDLCDENTIIELENANSDDLYTTKSADLSDTDSD